MLSDFICMSAGITPLLWFSIFLHFVLSRQHPSIDSATVAQLVNRTKLRWVIVRFLEGSRSLTALKHRIIVHGGSGRARCKHRRVWKPLHLIWGASIERKEGGQGGRAAGGQGGRKQHFHPCGWDTVKYEATSGTSYGYAARGFDGQKCLICRAAAHI